MNCKAMNAANECIQTCQEKINLQNSVHMQHCQKNWIYYIGSNININKHPQFYWNYYWRGYRLCMKDTLHKCYKVGPAKF